MAHPLTVAIHQPNYFPWLGYFYKIYASDVFVFLDDVQYSRRSFTARTPIPCPNQRANHYYLSVPLKYPGYTDKINAIYSNQTQAWRRKHLETIRHTYCRASYFNQYYPFVEKWMHESNEFSKLSDLNISLINKILGLLEIEKPIYLSGKLPIQGQKAQYIIELVKYLRGTTYLSGSGAKNYQNPEAFRRAGIQLVYNRFGEWLSKNPYRQFYSQEFHGGYSVLDALFNVGAEGIKVMFVQHQLTCRTAAWS